MKLDKSKVYTLAEAKEVLKDELSRLENGTEYQENLQLFDILDENGFMTCGSYLDTKVIHTKLYYELERMFK